MNGQLGGVSEEVHGFLMAHHLSHQRLADPAAHVLRVLALGHLERLVSQLHTGATNMYGQNKRNLTDLPIL
jgi:hypothetical protein